MSDHLNSWDWLYSAKQTQVIDLGLEAPGGVSELRNNTKETRLQMIPKLDYSPGWLSSEVLMDTSTSVEWKTNSDLVARAFIYT